MALLCGLLQAHCHLAQNRYHLPLQEGFWLRLLCGLLQAHCHLAQKWCHLPLQEGFWSWVSGVTDNALYPVMFLHYLETALPNLATGWHRQLFVAGLCLALAYLNYRVRQAWPQALSSLPAFCAFKHLEPCQQLGGRSVPGLADPKHFLLELSVTGAVL